MEGQKQMSELYGKCPAEVDLCLPQGQTWDTSIVWEADGDPVDLTGYIARMMLRTSVDASSPTVSLSTATSTMTALSNGTIGLSYSAISSAAITAATYLYDLEVQSPSGNVRRLMEGRAVVSREITR
jgi:meiotically up-regulated gene 157 (Mug157) protein